MMGSVTRVAKRGEKGTGAVDEISSHVSLAAPFERGIRKSSTSEITNTVPKEGTKT
jgi:hypothetical protein